MIIGRDNLERMPIPMQEEPYERFTLMWTSLSPHYILRENERVYRMAWQENRPRKLLCSHTGA